MINKNFYALTGMSIGNTTYIPNGFFGVNTKGETKKYYFYLDDYGRVGIGKLNYVVLSENPKDLMVCTNPSWNRWAYACTLILGNSTKKEENPYTINHLTELTPTSISRNYPGLTDFSDFSYLYSISKQYVNNTDKNILVTEAAIVCAPSLAYAQDAEKELIVIAKDYITPVVIKPGELYTFNVTLGL